MEHFTNSKKNKFNRAEHSRVLHVLRCTKVLFGDRHRLVKKPAHHTSHKCRLIRCHNSTLNNSMLESNRNTIIRERSLPEFVALKDLSNVRNLRLVALHLIEQLAAGHLRVPLAERSDEHLRNAGQRVVARLEVPW